MDTDRNLLFAVLALQADVLTQAQFIEGCILWTNQKSLPLADLFLERGWITAEDKAHVDYLLDRKLAKHGGDVQASLAQVAGDQVCQSLATQDGAAVEELLAHLTSLDRPPRLPATIDYRPTSRQRYTLTHLHAKGGIGQVWLARDPELGREVALKELRPDRADQPGIWARFLEEAKITGQLEHPGIVPIYELERGPSDQRPFYTMRFIKGRTLSAASRAYHGKRAAGQAGTLDLRDLLGALIAVCNAVAYAHARGVVHRDLKGSNVVLGDFGEVMVLDWGLAKVVGEKATFPGAGSPTQSLAPVAIEPEDSRDQTLAGQVLGTPPSMAPEQATGRLDQIDRRTDVYGLGTILYEILTSRTPFAGTDTQEILHKVISEAPRPPRQIVAATPPALEAVCLKALAKRPEERYDTAGDFALEIQHYLADEPVAAYRDPPAVRAARWTRRHRTGVGAAVAAVAMAVVCLAVAAGFLLAAYREADQQRAAANVQRDMANEQRDKAREHFLLARTAVDQFHTRVSESSELRAHGLELLRQKLLESAVDFYQKFVQHQDDDPALRAEQGRAYKRLADLSHILGRNEQAQASYDRARAIFRQLAEAHPQEWVYQEELALCDWKLGLHYHDNGRYSLAEPPYQEALALGLHLRAAQPEVLAYQQDLGNIQHSLARLYRDLGRYTLAEPLYDEALTLRHRLVKDHPEVIVYHDELAWTLFNLANLYNRTGRRDLSERTYLENLTIWQRLADAHPESPDYQNQVSMILNNLGNLYQHTGRPKKAEITRQDCLKVRLRLAEAHPLVTDYQEALCKIHENLGQGYHATGQLDLAEGSYHQALKIRQRLLEAYPDSLDIVAFQAESHGSMGLLCRDRGQWREALDWYGRAARALEVVLQKEPDHSNARQILRGVEGRRAVVLSKLGQHPEAEQALKRAALGGPEPTDRESRLCRALVRAYAGDHAGAVARANEVAGEHGLEGSELFDLARIYCLGQEGGRAVEVLRQARDAGYLSSAAAVARLRHEGDLAGLLSRDDYRKLLSELEQHK